MFAPQVEFVQRHTHSCQKRKGKECGVALLLNVRRQRIATSFLEIALIAPSSVCKMKSYILTLFVFFAPCDFWTTPLYSQDQPESYSVTVAKDSFIVTGYRVLAKTAGQWKTVGNFTFPTVSMLLKYRPHVRSHFGFDEGRERFIDVVQDVSSTISAVCEADGKVWVGFGFYEGEGWEGYGGIGFYDPNTNKVGVLRHPALVDCSVKSMMVTDTALCIQTVGHYELSSTVGNGLVIISRRTLFARAIVPPGTSTLWDKDDPASADSFYNKPIPEIMDDHRFVENSVPQYPPTVVATFQTLGLDSFMVRMANEERTIRERAASSAKVIQDTLKLPRQDGGWVSRGARTGIELEAGTYYRLGPDGAYYMVDLACPVSGVAFFRILVTGAYPFSENFGIRPSNVYPGFIDDDKRYMVVQEGESWVRETDRTRVFISIDKLETRNTSCIINGQPRGFQYFNPVIVSSRSPGIAGVAVRGAPNA